MDVESCSPRENVGSGRGIYVGSGANLGRGGGGRVTVVTADAVIVGGSNQQKYMASSSLDRLTMCYILHLPMEI